MLLLLLLLLFFVVVQYPMQSFIFLSSSSPPPISAAKGNSLTWPQGRQGRGRGKLFVCPGASIGRLCVCVGVMGRGKKCCLNLDLLQQRRMEREREPPPPPPQPSLAVRQTRAVCLLRKKIGGEGEGGRRKASDRNKFGPPYSSSPPPFMLTNKRKLSLEEPSILLFLPTAVSQETRVGISDSRKLKILAIP